MITKSQSDCSSCVPYTLKREKERLLPTSPLHNSENFDFDLVHHFWCILDKVGPPVLLFHFFTFFFLEKKEFEDVFWHTQKEHETIRIILLKFSVFGATETGRRIFEILFNFFRMYCTCLCLKTLKIMLGLWLRSHNGFQTKYFNGRKILCLWRV